MHREAAAEFGVGTEHDTERPDIETSSDRYATARFRGAVGRWLLEQQTRTIAGLLDLTGGQRLRVLDLGGGHGQLTSLLLKRGDEVVVHGSADACFGRIRPLLASGNGAVAPCVSNLWALPFPDRKFDLVVAVRLLGHVVRWQALLAEMTRVAERFVMLEFARKQNTMLDVLPGVGNLIFTVKRRVEKTTRPFFVYREESLREELMALGFRPVAVDAQFALPMVIHRLGRSPRASAAAEWMLRKIGVGTRLRSPAILLAERVHDGVNERRSPVTR